MGADAEAEVGALFAETIDYEEVLRAIPNIVVRELADYCVVELSEEGRLKPTGC